MGFLDEVEKVVNDRKQLTENGAIGYATTGKALLDMNFAVSSLRNKTEKEIETYFSKAYFECPLLAVKFAFYLRDVRGGMGERRSFRVCMKWLADNKPEIAKALIPVIAEYGRYDDLFELLDTSVQDNVLELIADQLVTDIKNSMENKSVSLLAKWMPSINASSAETRRKAKLIIDKLGLTERKYRKSLSALRKYIDVVEVKMSAKEWSNIKYETVPSKANLLYNNAFLRNDEMRRREYLDSLKKGETKINAGTLFPSDIVHKYGIVSYGGSSKYDETIEQLWKALPDYVENDKNTLVIRDGSGSMWSMIGGTNVTAVDVSTALSIYFAEHCTGEFHNKFITFSARPQVVDMSNAKSLFDKLKICKNHSDCSNTNIEATFDLILTTAIKTKMKQEDLPKNILIVSDMEFDYCISHRIGSTLFEELTERFENAGYEMPRLIFWNVMSRTGTIPVKENKHGVALVSGFSPAVYKMVLSDELDPYKCLVNQLNTERYQPIEDLILSLL